MTICPTTYPYPDDKGKTHYVGCWRERGHHNCAVAEVERLRGILEALHDMVPDRCQHEWIDARNEAVASGEWCPKCNAVRSA